MRNFGRFISFPMMAAGIVMSLSTSYAVASSSISVSDSISGSIGSLSDSVRGSSRSSSNAVNLADGGYKITDIAAADDHPGKMRLALQADGDSRDKDIYLYVPRDDYMRADLSIGQEIMATRQPYGVAFSLGDVKQPFVVVLADDWVSDLRSNALSL
jgi:hypothetical protein